jgi:hypothetical protein
VSNNADDFCRDVQDVDVDATSNRIPLSKMSQGELAVDHDHWRRMLVIL